MKLAHDRGLRGRDLLPPLRRRQGRRGARRRRSPCASATTLSCEMAGAQDAARRACRRMLGADVRVHRARRASAAASRRRRRSSASNPSTHATLRSGRGSGRGATRRRTRPTPLHRLRRLPRATAATRLLRDCVDGERDVETVIDDDGGLGPARPGRRRLPGRAQVAHRARRAGAAPDGGQHRRRRARHVQGPLLPRARSAPLPRRHADRRVGGRHRRRSTSTCATNTTAAARMLERELAALQRRSAVRRCRASTCAAAPAPTSAAKSRR